MRETRYINMHGQLVIVLPSFEHGMLIGLPSLEVLVVQRLRLQMLEYVKPE